MDKAELKLLEQRLRFARIMRRHIREEDGELSDDAFKRAVDVRYDLERTQPLLDPSE